MILGKIKGIAFIKDPDGYWIEIFDLKTIGKATNIAAWDDVAQTGNLLLDLFLLLSSFGFQIHIDEFKTFRACLVLES